MIPAWAALRILIVTALLPLAAFAATPATVPRQAPTPPAKADSLRTAAKDSLHADTAASADTSAARKLYEYISYPVLQMVTLPLEIVVVPVVKLALYPSKPPLRYFLDENVIDRTIKLISFGEDNRIMLYPTLNVAPGTGSSTGLTLRDQALFGRSSERAVAQGNLFVNGDWKWRSYMTASDLVGTGLNAKVSLSLNRVKNSSVWVPDTSYQFYYADSNTQVGLAISHLLFEQVAFVSQVVYRANRFGKAPPSPDDKGLRGAFFRNEKGEYDARMRGLDDSWADRIVSVALSRDTRNNQNIVLAGSDSRITWGYHFTDHDHDFHNWEGELTNYFKLGKERYEISSEEERQAGALSMKTVLEKMELENLKKELFNRKVLVTHLYAAQAFEVPGNHMPVYGLQTLGNDTPMRGYSGSRFRNYAIFSAGAEYRFPVLRLVDGVIFDEYGWAGREWDTIDYLADLKNSWGFGIRVRRPDIYLFRLQLGFHGIHGIQLNMSVDEPY